MHAVRGEGMKASFGLRGAPTIAAVLASHDNRGPGFDTVRLIAASSVALHHSLGIAMHMVKDDLLYKFSGGYTHLGLLSVAVFFAISGFLVTPGLLKSRSVLEFLSRRLMRIMPLLVLVVLFAAFVLGPILTTESLRDYFASRDTWTYLRNITTSLQLNLPGVTNHVRQPGINSPLWTLQNEWLCYFIVAAASMGLLLRQRVLFLAGWVAAVMACVLLYGFADADANLGRFGRLLYLFTYFGAGVVISLYSDRLRWSPAILVAVTFALLLVLYIGWAHLVAPFMVAYVAVGVGLLKMPWSTFLAKADLSYGTYLTHDLVLTTLSKIHAFVNPFALFAVCLPITLIVSWLTWTLVEKPSLKHKSLPAKWARAVLLKAPLGSRLLVLLEPKLGARKYT